LLVDDEPILEIVGYNLNQEGYQIFTAANGKEAIAKAKRNCLI
jgi:two-component system alkaline phosphatase synthesis response regulator PhoP